VKLEKLRRVMIPLNGGRGDSRLLDAIGSLSVSGASRIILVYVVEVPMALPLDAELPSQTERGERVLAHAEAKLNARLHGCDAIVLSELLQARSAGPAIVDSAHDQHADLIMLATQNRIQHGMISYGDSVDFVLKHATAEVIVIRLASEDNTER